MLILFIFKFTSYFLSILIFLKQISIASSIITFSFFSFNAPFKIEEIITVTIIHEIFKKMKNYFFNKK